jgi:VanZ family protein
MAVVLTMSSSQMSAENTGSIIGPLLAWAGLPPPHVDLVHGAVRKAAHLTEYGILAVLWRRAVVGSGVARPVVGGVLAVAIAVFCAAIDETHQSFLMTRTGSVGDVGLDSFGALTAIVAAQLGWWKTADLATGALLWIAVVGGIGALALDAATGSRGGVLWLTVPVAAALLAYRWRRSASRS